MIKTVPAAVLLATVLTACASLRSVQKEGDVLALADLINTGDAGTLAELSAVPFLFDREILLLSRDTQILWENLTEGGFLLSSAEVVRIGEVDGESSLIFDDSMDVELFFRKYVPETSRIAVVEGDDFTATLILNDKENGYPKILGIKIDHVY